MTFKTSLLKAAEAASVAVVSVDNNTLTVEAESILTNSITVDFVVQGGDYDFECDGAQEVEIDDTGSCTVIDMTGESHEVTFKVVTERLLSKEDLS